MAENAEGMTTFTRFYAPSPQDIVNTPTSCEKKGGQAIVS